ncbi:LysR family transcriptional regulator [Acidimangrovimonas sediminis]|uniref:LysR family transcriptional regulator n=1 Tax=Acidimangrovimonas sediminis TaxID=2056283 RepID=UPI000C7FB001|nr:LysR family transcriptional regulator [Acidimangrovimonas sediminis]
MQSAESPGPADPDWQPELRTLRYFICVAEEKSVTGAARTLRIAQPALSRQISGLERDLGFPLFLRTPRGVELTEAGEILLARAYAIMGQIRQARHDVTAHADVPRGTVVVGMPPTPGEFIAPPLLAHIKAHYPEIELRFVEGFSRELERWLSNGEISLAVMHDAPMQDDVQVSDLLVEQLYMIGPPGKLEKPVYTLAEAVTLPLIMPSRPNFLRILIDKHADALGLTLNVQQRVDGVWHLKALVRQGHGFTMLTYGGVMSEVQQGTLEAVPIVDPRMEWTLGIATKRDQRRKRTIQIVEQAVEAIVGDLVRRGIWK